MNCINCTENIKCKKCYDKERYLKIKEGNWNFNPTCPLKLSSLQEEVLAGSILGDAYIFKYKNNINSGLSIARTLSDFSYLEFEFNLFKDFIPSGIKYRNYLDKRTNKIYSTCYFRTQVSSVFNKFRDKWYIKNEKIIPLDLILTPQTCAIWFCDDGSFYSKKSHAKISLYTDGFKLKYVKFLKNILDKTVGVNCKITHKNSCKTKNKGYYLYLNTEDAVKFIIYIKDYMPSSMSRKSDKWKEFIKCSTFAIKN